MRKLLGPAFFNRKTELVAKDLLGKFIVIRVGKKIIAEMITETEAYVGPHDLACHSRGGLRTARTEIMYQESGTIYVYFTYGMHWMLNIVTEEKEFPAAILLRGTENISGPARVTKALNIDKKLNGEKIGKKSGLWFEDRGTKISPKRIKRTPRIGIRYAGPIWSKKKLRFLLD